MTTTPLPPLDWVAMLKDAIGIVKGKPHYKRLIDGTPLSNDVPVWMADFAMLHATQARADLEAENQRLRDHMEAIEQWKAEGEQFFGDPTKTGILFQMAVWWADRPWRDRAALESKP